MGCLEPPFLPPEALTTVRHAADHENIPMKTAKMATMRTRMRMKRITISPFVLLATGTITSLQTLATSESRLQPPPMSCDVSR